MGSGGCVLRYYHPPLLHIVWKGGDAIMWRRPPWSNQAVLREGKLTQLRLFLSLFLFFLVTFSTIGVWYADLRMRPSIESWAQQRAVNIATRAINLAVQTIMANNIDSSTLLQIQRDDTNRIVGVSFNWGAINRIVSDMTTQVQNALNIVKNEEMGIPLGTVTGIKFLAARGPRIPVRILPIGSVDATPEIRFTEKGINQTLYTMYLRVNVQVRIVVPFVTTTVPVTSTVPVVEQIIVGDVPHVYLNWRPTTEELEKLSAPIMLQQGAQ